MLYSNFEFLPCQYIYAHATNIVTQSLLLHAFNVNRYIFQFRWNFIKITIYYYFKQPPSHTCIHVLCRWRFATSGFSIIIIMLVLNSGKSRKSRLIRVTWYIILKDIYIYCTLVWWRNSLNQKLEWLSSYPHTPVVNS